MAYTILHNGTYWFQIRVPQNLVSTFGRIIRLNLQTSDRPVAQRLAYRLAGDWLDRFAAARLGVFESAGELAPALPALPAPQPALPRPETASNLFPAAPRPAPATAAVPVKAPRNAAARLTSAFDDLYIYWKQLNPERVGSTSKEVLNAVREFKPLIKGKATLASIERSDLVRYRDQLIARRLSRSTISKKVGFISSLLQVAFDAGQLPQNVGRGIRIPKAQVETLVRRPFTKAELHTIFTSPVFAEGQRPRGAGGEAAVWVPMLALATGARLEEICQLRIVDLRIDPEHGPLLRITDEGEQQRVKTIGSRRTIPIHPALVEAGLIHYWSSLKEQGAEWLFPVLEPDHDGRRGGTYSQWFSRYLRGPEGCGITDKRVVFYAFRHTFKTLCREAEITEEVHDALTGHVTGAVGRGYPIKILPDACSQAGQVAIFYPQVKHLVLALLCDLVPMPL